MHSIYVYTDIYQRLKFFASSCIYINKPWSRFAFACATRASGATSDGDSALRDSMDSALRASDSIRNSLRENKCWYTENLFHCWLVVFRADHCVKRTVFSEIKMDIYFEKLCIAGRLSWCNILNSLNEIKYVMMKYIEPNEEREIVLLTALFVREKWYCATKRQHCPLPEKDCTYHTQLGVMCYKMQGN